mgnify:CR=1 FL=1
MNMSYKYRYDEDNRKKVLTKGSIAKELNKKNKIAIIGLSISLPLLLLIWLLALNILDSYYGCSAKKARFPASGTHGR